MTYHTNTNVSYYTTIYKNVIWYKLINSSYQHIVSHQLYQNLLKKRITPYI